MNEIKDLIEISKYAGERFDLVQAAGGNTSVKFENDEMIIKASGYTLSEVNINNGFSRVRTKDVIDIVTNKNLLNIQDKREREYMTSQLMKHATIDIENRPSIETLLHSLLLKYTLHTHPIVVNMVVSRKDFKETLHSIFKNETVAIVDYETPGIELALKLHEEINRFDATPNIIFLKNHGLIITANEKQDIADLNENVLNKIENFLKINMSIYKLTNSISKLSNDLDQNNNISLLSEDIVLNKYLKTNKKIFFLKPFCPDTLVYCGVNIIEIDSLSDSNSLETYKKEYHELPKVIIYDNKIFLLAQTIKKAKEIEEVLKFHIMVLSSTETEMVNFLNLEEMAYLSNWEAEKYRQNL